MLAASLLALFWSVLPLIMSNADVASGRLWASCSTAWALLMVPANLLFWRHLREHGEGVPLPAVLQTTALAVVVVLQVFNALALQLAWPFLVAIALLFGGAATAFVLIVVSDPEAPT